MYSTLEISRQTLLHNARLFIERVGLKHFAPVLKSNAYGHGLKEVYTILKEVQPPWICVNYVSEAEELRELGFSGRILVVGPFIGQELVKRCAAKNIDINISNFVTLEQWLAEPSPPLAHLKMDTGLSRQGFSQEDVAALIVRLRKAPKHRDKCVGLYTHFANVEDVQDYNYAFRQLEILERDVKEFAAAGMKFSVLHAASSASTLLLEQSRFHICRVGMSLYGHWPSDATRLSYYQSHGDVFDLQPTLSWKSTLTSIRQVGPGDHIGYGCQYKVMRPMRIGVVPVGYYEGYPRIAGNSQSYVLIQGVRCMILGRICMNMMMVDLSHLAKADLGEEVVLIGKQGGEKISAETVAAWAETIQYELLSRLHADIPRVIV